MISKFNRYDGDMDAFIAPLHTDSDKPTRKRCSPVKQVATPDKKIKSRSNGSQALLRPSLSSSKITKSTLPTESITRTPKAHSSKKLEPAPYKKPTARVAPMVTTRSSLVRPSRNRSDIESHHLSQPQGSSTPHSVPDHSQGLLERRSRNARQKHSVTHRVCSVDSSIHTPNDAKVYVQKTYSDLEAAINSYKDKAETIVNTEIQSMLKNISEYKSNREALREEFDKLRESKTIVGFDRAKKTSRIHNEISEGYRRLRQSLVDFDIHTLEVIHKLKNEVSSNFIPKRSELFDTIVKEQDKFTLSQYPEGNARREVIKKIRKILSDAAEKIFLVDAEQYRNDLLSYIEAQGERLTESSIDKEFDDIGDLLEKDQKEMNSEYMASIQEGKTLSNNALYNGEYDQSTRQARKTLGVEAGCTRVEIRKAYIKLARENHPDKHMENQEKYTKIFKEIGEAYVILSRY